jgi:soluble lytic murein transglycosylase
VAGRGPRGRYTLEVVRRATAVLGLVLVAGGAEGSPAPARRLADAFAAYRRGDLDGARAALGEKRLINRDYALYLAAQGAALGGDPGAALPLFREVGTTAGSRFARIAAWRAADCLWDLGRAAEARAAYEKLVPGSAGARPQAGDLTSGPLDGDPGVGLERIARAHEKEGDARRALAAWRRLALELPAHPLAAGAVAAIEEGGAPLTAAERIERAERLTAQREWPRALDELALVSDDDAQRALRDYWIGTTLYKMRRQYERAGRLLIAVHEAMGARAASALFHGARALSRADLDDEAIRVYGEVVKKYPSSDWAAEAQYLSGWLEFNRGRYREALPGLRALLAKFPRSKWADDAHWTIGFSHYLLGEHAEALRSLERVAAQGGALEGGKGRYWKARALAALGRGGEARAELARLVSAFPLSWYALLARERLLEEGVEIGPFGDRAAAAVPALGRPAPKVAADRLIARVDELLAADLDVEAGVELRRGERAFIQKHTAARALPVLFARYERAGNHNRPWLLAEVHGGRALAQPPRGAARTWWERAYPRAFRRFIEKHEKLGKNPPLYLYAIMRKESGFDPHVVSYADAIGLMQMIPATTKRVAKELEMEWGEDLLYDPEKNVKVGSWYIGSLVQKFKGQIPLAAGSFNSGPRPVMRWLDQNGRRPMDELVELVAYTQTREYMKKVTSYYAHYVLLYEGKPYRQPLSVDAAYVKNEIDY